MRAIDVANLIIERSQSQPIPVTNLRLQKLLYFVQKEMLQKYSRVAFNDDIEAWQYGPVVRDVYNEFSDFIDMPLIATEEINIMDSDLIEAVDAVLADKSRVATWKLVKQTHEAGSPWDKAYREGIQVIDVNDIETLKN